MGGSTYIYLLGKTNVEDLQEMNEQDKIKVFNNIKTILETDNDDEEIPDDVVREDLLKSFAKIIVDSALFNKLIRKSLCN